MTRKNDAAYFLFPHKGRVWMGRGRQSYSYRLRRCLLRSTQICHFCQVVINMGSFNHYSSDVPTIRTCEDCIHSVADEELQIAQSILEDL